MLVVSPLIALMHAYAGVFTPTSSVKPNPFANVTIKIDVIFTFKLNACANSVYQAFPPAIEGLGTRLHWAVWLSSLGCMAVSVTSELESLRYVQFCQYM